jgi:hypothetical protein
MLIYDIEQSILGYLLMNAKMLPLKISIYNLIGI